MSRNKVVTTLQVENDQAIKAFSDMEGAMTRASLAGNLLATGITSGLGLIAEGAKSLTGIFNDAASVQTEAISIAGDLSKITSLSFDEATGKVEEFSKTMSRVASSLPGDTQSFVSVGKSLIDEVADPFTDAAGVLDESQFDKNLEKIATNAGFYANKIGMSAEQAGTQISKFLGGNSTMTELKQLDFFQNNKAITKIIEDYLEVEGKELKAMSSRERLDLFLKASEVSEEVLAASKDSVSGLIEGFRSSMFDPQTGLFGLMRKLDDGSTVFSIASDTVSRLLGAGGLFEEGAALLSTLGISGDPMEVLANGIFWLNGWIGKATDWLSKIRGKGDKLPDFNLQSTLKDLPQEMGSWLASQVNKLWTQVGNVDAQQIGGLIGEGLAGVINFAMSYVRQLDYGALAQGVFKIGLIAVIAAGQALASIDWGNVATVLFKGMMTATAAAVVVLAASIAGLTAPIGAAIVGLGAAAVGIFIGLKTWWTNQGESIRSSIQGLLESVRSLFSGLQARVTGLLNRIPGVSIGSSKVSNRATGLDQMGLFAAIAREQSAAPGTDIVIANSSEAILNPNQTVGLLTALNSNRGSGLSIGSITINASGTSNPKVLAKQVMQEISKEWNKFQQTKMAPAY